MQTNEAPTSIMAEAEDDQDSLFGSPPPSPTRGRSPLPNLALPNASGVATGTPISGNVSGSCSTQNVGTIALPGSHLYSELPVNPLALSLSYAPHGHALRPPAQPQSTLAPQPQQTQFYIPTAHIPTPSPPWSRASSTAPTTTKKRKATAKARSESRSAPPPIHLPDPSDPPPRNFLRNQSALLGTAGLVGGVKPSKLSVHRHTRGTTVANPIVVEDEHPRLGLNHHSSQAYLPTIDPALLPAPSNEDIVATLIRQKDIFPVLESILKLIAAGSCPSASEQQPARPPIHAGSDWRTSSRPLIPNHAVRESSVTSEGRPTKKRKLNRVPAGATDWDVPYPFQNGEGPQAYQTTWERERGKQLVSQLIGLIKTAARKAATRTYLQREEMRKHSEEQKVPKNDPPLPDVQSAPKVKGHYRPITVTYGLDGEAASVAQTLVQDVLTDASNGSSKGAVHDPYSQVGAGLPSDAGTGATNAQPSTPFDQLIASLLAASPEQGGGGADANGNSSEGGQPSSPSTPASNDDGQAEFDPALFDSWMSILQTFPMPEEGFAQGQEQGQTQDQQTQLPTSMSLLSSTNSDATPFSANSVFNLDMGTHSTSTSSISSSSATMCPTSVTNNSTARSQDAPGATDVDKDMNAGASNGYNSSSLNPIPTLGTAPADPYPDFAIDPALLAISIPQPRPANNDPLANDTATRPPSLAPSPMPSTSSLADLGPMTPSSAGWDTGTPEVFSGLGFSEDGRFYRSGRDAGRGDGGQGMWHRAIRNSMVKAQHVNEGVVEDAANVLLELSAGLAKGKGKAKAVTTKSRGKKSDRDVGQVQPVAATTQQFGATTTPGPYFTPPTAVQTRVPTAATTGTATSTSTPSGTVAAPAKSLNKEDILRRAKERRRQLSEEIAKAKIQLWETTIEQGVLTHFERQLSS